MTTLISDPLRWTADQIVHHLDYPSAVLSGLAPDPRHLADGGFHCSIDDLKAHGNGDDYSNRRANDKGFNPHYGAAFDVSLAKADMIRAYGRVRAVWADPTDPRRVYVNAINCWDGSGDATRFDFDAGVAEYASPDHEWHAHGEFHRRFCCDWTAARAVVSIFAGESKTTWLANQQGDDMPTVTEIWNAEFGSGTSRHTAGEMLADARAAAISAGAAVANLAAALASHDTVNEQALGQSIAAAITPAILAALPTGTLTEQQVEDAIRNVLKTGVGGS